MSDAATCLPNKNKKRVDIERRQFSYAHCIPERRSGKDRRRAAKKWWLPVNFFFKKAAAA